MTSKSEAMKGKSPLKATVGLSVGEHGVVTDLREKTKRDPRKEPKAGDEVMFGPQGQIEIYHVLRVETNRVHYLMGPMRVALECSLNRWREWAASVEVIHAVD